MSILDGWAEGEGLYDGIDMLDEEALTEKEKSCGMMIKLQKI